MKIGIIGSGGREHALCYKLSQSPQLKKIYCFPGNAGTRDIGENIEIDIDNFEFLKNFILEKKNRLCNCGARKTFGQWVGRLFGKI